MAEHQPSAGQDKLVDQLLTLMTLPGLSGHEGRVRRYLAQELQSCGYQTTTDNPGNLIATIKGDEAAPSVMLYTHMDQLGFVVRKIEANGFIRVERLGGVPERALASQEVLLCVGNGSDVPGVLANKSHHATSVDEKFNVVPVADLYIDIGLSSLESVLKAGIDIGTPVVYAPSATRLHNNRIMGTSVDDRAGCAVILEVARQLIEQPAPPTIHLVFSVQEEYNLRGAMIAARKLQPDIAIQLDLIQACDTPDMLSKGDAVLDGGPGMSLYSFHGRGTLNGTIAHPALAWLFESTASNNNIPLQKSAQSGVLTDNAYVQLEGQGIAAIDMGFPMRYSHSSREICSISDLQKLAQLLTLVLHQITPSFSLDRDDYIK